MCSAVSMGYLNLGGNSILNLSDEDRGWAPHAMYFHSLHNCSGGACADYRYTVCAPYSSYVDWAAFPGGTIYPMR